MDTGSIDLISNLPDALVCHILSFLSTKDAASTSILSKRWRYLLAFVPVLNFDTSVYNRTTRGNRKSYMMRESFKLFVDRMMALQGNVPLKKFYLKCKARLEPSYFNAWIFNVLDRGVVDFDLYMAQEYAYLLPSNLSTSETLVRLKLKGRYDFCTNLEELFLPKLKSLHLNDISFEPSGAAFARVISGCPVLEELVLIDVMCCDGGSFSVSKPTLKRLTVCCDCVQNDPNSVVFDTPNLVYLQYSDTIAVKYPKVRFDSLVEASLGLQMTRDQNVNAAELLMGIYNVEILYLSSDTFEVLNYRFKSLPVFNNLIHLTIETNQELAWVPLPRLLENCPNLETLVFEGLLYKDTNECEDKRFRFKDTYECWVKDVDRCICKPWEGTPVCLSASPVKTLKILKFADDMNMQMQVIGYLLETMPNLEQVVLYCDDPFDDDLSIVSTQLQMLEKVASPKCKIEVISDNISFSTTVHSISSANELVFFNNNFPV